MPPDSEVYFHVPGVARTSWDRTFRLVHVEWVGWANSAEFATLLDAEMRALREHGGTRSSLTAGARGFSARIDHLDNAAAGRSATPALADLEIGVVGLQNT
jgi:hypothetical protein